MEELAQSQAYVFIIYILSGVLIGVFFDVFRIYRRSFKTPDVITYIQDILFWICTGIFLLFMIFKFNNGELRWFIFLGIIIGILIYMIVFSKHFIKINVIIITFFKKVFLFIFKVLYIPLSFVKKLVFKPISFMFINLKAVEKRLVSYITDIFLPKKTKNVEK